MLLSELVIPKVSIIEKGIIIEIELTTATPNQASFPWAQTPLPSLRKAKLPVSGLCGPPTHP